MKNCLPKTDHGVAVIYFYSLNSKRQEIFSLFGDKIHKRLFLIVRFLASLARHSFWLDDNQLVGKN